jgi:hypothetical protein
MVEEAQ